MLQPWICSLLLLLFFDQGSHTTTNERITAPGQYTTQQFAVVIDEIMADPSPPVGLPNNEWVELKNTSHLPVNLEGWRLGDASGLSAPFPALLMQPDSFLVVCAASAANTLAAFGTVVAIDQFPTLNNTGEILYLLSAEKKLVHALRYADKWYQDAGKKVGGWSLEMIDPTNPCAGMSNWISSSDVRGGTPGKRNSVDNPNPDTQAPRLLRAFSNTSSLITLVFDQSLDSVSTSRLSSYFISDGINAIAVQPLSPLFDRVELQLAGPLVAGKTYTVTVNGIADCAGNNISTSNSIKLGLAQSLDTASVIFNEILFNPPSSGTDFIELYNRGKNTIDLQEVSLATRNSGGAVTNVTSISNEPYLLFPGDFIVLTENISAVKTNYIARNPDAFLEMISMPAMNDDKGTILLLDQQGRLLDELTYSEKWHFSLLDKKEGVSLERLDYTAPTQAASNWHSAATSVGYATPTYKNSQAGTEAALQGTVTLTPEIVSPDNDGRDDVAGIRYTFPEPGYIANITIFDARGSVVRHLVKNGLCGTSGSFQWDGLGEKNQRLATGVYVVLTEVFNGKGQTKQFKMPVVVARLGL